MNEELKTVLNNILFQLHVLTSQNFTAMALTEGEDPISEKTREYGMTGLSQEKEWMDAYLKERDAACTSAIGSSSDY